MRGWGCSLVGGGCLFRDGVDGARWEWEGG